MKVSTKTLKDGSQMVTARGGGFVFGQLVWQEGKSWRVWPYADRRDGRGLIAQPVKVGGGKGAASRTTGFKTKRAAMGMATMLVKLSAMMYR